jgi:hypothetical protein
VSGQRIVTANVIRAWHPHFIVICWPVVPGTCHQRALSACMEESEHCNRDELPGAIEVRESGVCFRIV